MTLGQLAGVKIKINPLFFILLTFAAINNQLLTMSIFFILLLAHEIGHIIMAFSLKLHVFEINLLPLGGRVRIVSGDEIEPQKEIKLALAGPIVNILLLAFGILGNSLMPLNFREVTDIFIKGNVMLIFFNLIPLLPLDGGRIYRAMLVKSKGYIDATKYILLVTFLIITTMIIVSIIGIVYHLVNVTLLVLAIFLLFNFFLEFRTYRLQFIKHYLAEETQVQKRVWHTHTLTASWNTAAKKVIKQFVPGKFNIVLLIGDHGDVEGRLTETQIMQSVHKNGPLIKLKNILKTLDNY